MAGEKTTRPKNQNVAAHLPQAFAQSHDTVPTVTTNAPYNVAPELCPDGPQKHAPIRHLLAGLPRRRAWLFLRDSSLLRLPSATFAELPPQARGFAPPATLFSPSWICSCTAFSALFKSSSGVGMAGLTSSGPFQGWFSRRSSLPRSHSKSRPSLR